MIHFDFDDAKEKQESKDTLVCPIHGDYPNSLKNFGCPDCAEDVLDDEEVEDWRDRQVRKGGYRER